MSRFSEILKESFTKVIETKMSDVLKAGGGVEKTNDFYDELANEIINKLYRNVDEGTLIHYLLYNLLSPYDAVIIDAQGVHTRLQCDYDEFYQKMCRVIEEYFEGGEDNAKRENEESN